MRMLTIQGRVVADAQVKSTTNGRAYIEFRFANNEKMDDENVTFWLRVTSFDTSHINLAQYITKGKPLTLVGDYSNKVYAAKDGTCQIDNNLRLKSLYFSELSKRENGENGTTTAVNVPVTSGETPKTETPTKAKKKAEPKATPKPAPVVTDEEDDDLPF